MPRETRTETPRSHIALVNYPASASTPVPLPDAPTLATPATSMTSQSLVQSSVISRVSLVPNPTLYTARIPTSGATPPLGAVVEESAVPLNPTANKRQEKPLRRFSGGDEL
jgi:hypothetical protein